MATTLCHNDGLIFCDYWFKLLHCTSTYMRVAFSRITLLITCTAHVSWHAVLKYDSIILLLLVWDRHSHYIQLLYST